METKITLVGPRSSGKTTLSKKLSTKLKYKYLSSDDSANEHLKEYGGLDKVIKDKRYSLIFDIALDHIKEIMNENYFVYDLAGGSVSSSKCPDLCKKIRKEVSSNSFVIGLLVYEKDSKKSIDLLFQRERKREHFKDMEQKKLYEKVKKSYTKLEKFLPSFCDKIIFIEDKSPEKILNEILNIFEF